MSEYQFTYRLKDFEILPVSDGGFRMSALVDGSADISYDFCPRYGDLEEWSIDAVRVDGWKADATQEFDLPSDHPMHAMICVALANGSARDELVEALAEYIDREHGPFASVEADLAADYRASV